MFRPDPRIRSLPVQRERVAALVESINLPQIQVPGRGAQPAAGHLCSILNANGSASVYVALHLATTGENVVYVHEPREVGGDVRGEAEREGLAFLESMGFMLDDVQFGTLTVDAQEQALRRCPLFSATAAIPAPPATSAPAPAPQPPAASAAPAPATAPAAGDAPSALARLLSNL